MLFVKCQIFYSSALGIDSTPDWLEKEDLEKEFTKQDISLDNAFTLDTIIFFNKIKEYYKEKTAHLNKKTDSIEIKKYKKILKDDNQPVQVRFFKKKNQVFKLVNCYLDNPIKQDWNESGAFNTFPPYYDDELLKADDKNLDFFLKCVYNLKGEKVSTDTFPNKDYYIVVFWNQFFKKASNNLIKTVKEFKENNKNKDIGVLYINNQNYEIWSKIDNNQKNEIISNLNN